MKALVIVLFGATAVFGQAADPARTLYDTGVKDEAAGRYTRALLTLDTLTQSFPDHPLAAAAKNEISALRLFSEGLAQMKAGKSATAFVTFHAVAQIYAESPLAKQAEAICKVIDPEANAPTVKELELHGPWPVTQDEIHQRLAEWEIPVGLEMPYEAVQVERARKALEDLVAEHGQPNQQVRVNTEFDRTGSACVVFTLMPGRQGGGTMRMVERPLAMLRHVVPFARKKAGSERS